MASLRRAAIRSIEASSADPDGRKQQIAAVENPSKRAGLMAVHKIATSYPSAVFAVLRLEDKAAGIKKIGEGYISEVYKIGQDTVMKVDKDSVGLSRRERRQLADRMLGEHQALVEYVGPAVLPHEIDIGPHPEDRYMKAVRITQPFIEVDYLKLNEKTENIDVLADRLQQANSSYPGLFDELETMIDGSRALFAERQLSTDILGVDNVGVALNNGHLTIVDAQPVNTQYPSAQADIDTYFGNLSSAIRLAA